MPKAGRNWNVQRSNQIHQKRVPEAGVACTSQYGKDLQKMQWQKWCTTISNWLETKELLTVIWYDQLSYSAEKERKANQGSRISKLLSWYLGWEGRGLFWWYEGIIKMSQGDRLAISVVTLPHHWSGFFVPGQVYSTGETSLALMLQLSFLVY